MEHVKIFVDDKEIDDIPLILPLVIGVRGDYCFLNDDDVKCLLEHERKKLIEQIINRERG